MSDAGRTLIIDHKLGKAWYSDDTEGRRSVDAVINALALEEIGMGDPVLDHPTRKFEIQIEDRTVQVDVLTHLPNVYAYGHLEYHDDDALALELARLPGLPARLRLTRKQGTMTLEVVAIRERSLDRRQ